VAFREPSTNKGPEDADLNKPGSLKEELQIGEVDAAKLDSVHKLLKECSIDNIESSGWNCQDWGLERLEKLRAEGFVDETYVMPRHTSPTGAKPTHPLTLLEGVPPSSAFSLCTLRSCSHHCAHA
jgi:hypothetical protein